MSISVDRSKRWADANLLRAEADLCEAIAGVAVCSARRRVAEAELSVLAAEEGLRNARVESRAVRLASERVWEEIAAERNAERDADAGSASEAVA